MKKRKFKVGDIVNVDRFFDREPPAGGWGGPEEKSPSELRRWLKNYGGRRQIRSEIKRKGRHGHSYAGYFLDHGYWVFPECFREFYEPIKNIKLGAIKI